MTTLRFEKINLLCGQMGPESRVPDIIRQDNIQNKTKFDLDEYDEIYEAYGQRHNAYPYRQQDDYSRKLENRAVDAAILENDLMRAEFLPGFGGRLWKLYDKVNQRDVLYTNDCLRASNLAIRNAWFSGGSEWNCGVIGHTSFTMDRIFAAKVVKDGMPVLRMYAYERIRGVVYQMDFWLDEKAPALNCHMSVNNSNKDVVPMYWWSNIASPMYPGGRLLVPAHKAYTYDKGTIVKVDIPCPEEGVDASRYETIPISKDFFFALDEGAPRWIANVDKNGIGMLHTSTARLQSRKLFVWGQNKGSWHWQEYLTEKAGPYVELQAGLGKTQYGCIPMAPHTTWEWTERYESIQLTPEQQKMSFDEVSQSVSRQIFDSNVIAPVDQLGHALLRIPGQVMHQGTGDGALRDALMRKQGLGALREHLDFSSSDQRQQPWKILLETGVLPQPKELFPTYDPIGSEWLELLKASVSHPEGENWYAYYCISLLERENGRMDLAWNALEKSLALNTTACNLYVKAVYLLEEDRKTESAQAACAGLALGGKDLSFAKAALQVLICCEQWQQVLDQIATMPDEISRIAHIQLQKSRALYELGRYEEALAILEHDGGLQLDDVREGDNDLGDLWAKVSFALTRETKPVPNSFDFDALGVGYHVD